jgi:hypothetical protein
LHPAKELAAHLLPGQAPAAARVGDDEVERGRIVGGAAGSHRRLHDGRDELLVGERPRARLGSWDDLDVAASPSVETEVAFALVERPEARVLAEEAHRGERNAAGGRR